MVKAIADQAKVRTPNFFAFILKFALPVLLPVFVLVSFLFFRP
jgi:K+-transporting ATPase A subunit